MSLIVSKIKDLIDFIRNSSKEVLLGSLFVLLSMSGFISAAITRSLDFDGILISVVAIIVEIIGLISCYLLFTTFFREKEEDENKKSKKP